MRTIFAAAHTPLWVLSASLLGLLSSGCDLLESTVFGQEDTALASADTSPEGLACANLEKQVGEPADRCRAEMGKFLKQCPEVSSEVLSCMASASSPAAIKVCTVPCLSAGADEVAPPVPPQLDTPALETACNAVGRLSDKSTPAGHEACRRMVARDIGNCPTVADKVLECYAAITQEDDITDCMMLCVEGQVRAQAEAADNEKPSNKRKRGSKRNRGKKRKKQ